MSNTSTSAEINSVAIDAVTEGVNRVDILDSEVKICANCGKEGNDVTNTCNKCKSVMYCNAACKKKHRHKHKKECEEHLKRAAERVAELHDEKLFNQPPILDDCPICMIRLPSLELGHVYMSCCGKVICCGCICAPVYDDKGNEVNNQKCPFCRTPPASSEKEMIKRYKKRIELNDAVAFYTHGGHYSNGQFGLPQNYAKAIEHWRRAGELGKADAYNKIGYTYEFGNGVEMDKKKAMYYFELAAMGGDVLARHNLGAKEEMAGNYDRALRHWMMAVEDGSGPSLKSIGEYYKEGHAKKDDFAKALRSYQAYLNEIKSDQRDKAAAVNGTRYYDSAF